MYYDDPPIESAVADAALRSILEEYSQVQSIYQAAIQTVNVRLETLNNEFRTRNRHNPIHHIRTRVKTPQSIMRKLKERGSPLTMTSAKKNLHDIAGVRVICHYVDDIYIIANMLTGQDDIELIEEKDYIRHPKENGYRSLHLVVDVPVYLSNAKLFIPVEVQIRTVAMDFWASLEHNLRYKASEAVPAFIVDELKNCAEIISQTDDKMQEIFKALNLLRDEPQPFGWNEIIEKEKE